MTPDTPEPIRDEFLSEEDLDLRTLTLAEVMAWWQVWFAQAQDTNDADRWEYSHGVFECVPDAAREHDDPSSRPSD